MNLNRLHHFDVLKGIAIFMVVMGHVITFCIRELDRATLFKFIGEIHMPLFFFISGWFTFGRRDDGSLKMPRLGKRAIQLIVPMIVVSTLWIFYFPHSGLETPFDSTFVELWLSPSKNGYWFLLCLFEMMVLYALVRPLCGRTRRVAPMLCLVGATWTVLVAAAYVFSNTNLGNFLGLQLLATYWPAFMFGAVASAHRDGFSKLTGSPVATTAALIVGAAALYYVCWYWEFPLANLLGDFGLDTIIGRAVLHICLAIVAVAVIAPWTTRAYGSLLPGQRPGTWIRLWTYLGVNSLGIYLLHYYFLFPMASWRSAMDAMNVGFAPLFVVSAVWAAVIIVLVLGLIRIISISKPLSLLLTGKK